MRNFDKYVDKMLDGRYHIQRVIGVGGMAVVFEAQDIVMNIKVAVKMLKDDIAGDEQAVQRFINESQAVSMLSHPNIVKIYDVSVKGSLKYIVMERVDGITLKSYMRRKGALSTDETLSYTEQVLSALQHAHSKGIIHRDIKPQNILLLKNGKVKVTDFGIAKLLDADSSQGDGKTVGTVYYISPEQANGVDIDCRSDLYSTGVMMYEMASGVLPFNGDTPLSVAMMQINDEPTPPSEINSEIPRGLEQIILGAMDKRPERRFQSAEQMLRYVKQLRSNPDCIFVTRKKTGEENGTTAVGSMKKKSSTAKTSKKKQSSSMFPIILGVTAAFLIVATIVIFNVFDMFIREENENRSTEVIIADVVGKLYDEDSIDEFFPSSLYNIMIEYKFSDKHESQTIISQEPIAGSEKKIKKGGKQTVTLTISRGTEKLLVPDYSTLDYRTAKLEAEKKGFKCEVREMASETVELGYVIKTEPAARTEVSYGSKLIIYYSKGTPANLVTVPELVGYNPEQAYSKMKGEFKVGAVEYDYSDEFEKGIIISQSLEAGSKAIYGSHINFIISLGKEFAETEPIDPPSQGGEDITQPVTTKPSEGQPPETESNEAEAPSL